MLFGHTFTALIPLAGRTTLAPRDLSESVYDAGAIIGFGILIILFLVGLWLFNLYKKNRAAIDFWKDIEEHLNDYDLRPRIRDRLIRLLKRMSLRDPFRAITNIDTFDRLLREKFIAIVGQNACDDVRRVLFLMPAAENTPRIQESPIDNVPLSGDPDLFEPGTILDESPPTWGTEPETTAVDSMPYTLGTDQDEAEINGTYSLKPGNEVALRFASTGNLHTCTIVFIESQDFIVTLPPSEKLKYLPKEGETVEGFLNKNHNYYSFESIVQEVFYGEARLCRLRHTSLIHEVRRREFSRAQIGLEFSFYSFSEQAMIASTSSKNQAGKIVQMRTGTLYDISAGGCAVETADMTPPIQPRDFLRFPITLLDNDDPIEVFGLVLSIVPVEEEPDSENPRAEADKKDTDKEGYSRLHVIFVGIDALIRERLEQSVSRLNIKTQGQD